MTSGETENGEAVNGDREAQLQRFVDWAAETVTGDEKGQAQVFLDRLFKAFGRKGAQEAGGTFETRVHMLFDEGKKTRFADYVWKNVVLIEMKKRGTDLSKVRQQAFDYWTHIAPGRPRYVVLCNFDEFWVYDFNTQLYSPKDKLALVDLPTRWGPLAFLFPTDETPVFGNDGEKVTREAADKLAALFKKLLARGVERDLAQRFVLQAMVALFAEDIGLLPRYFFTHLLKECDTPAKSYDLIGGLFAAMNAPESPTGGRYKGVRYFNGGLFRDPARLELRGDELVDLRGGDSGLLGAAHSDWSKVSPEIFGTIFQQSLGKTDRHAYGAHFTSAGDIMKIVKPTISDPWNKAVESAGSAAALVDLLERLTTLRVLDPACGSGNFLYLAYREMKRLETRIRDRLAADFPGSVGPLLHVTAKQFFGLDVNGFAVELAKITLMIGRKLAIEELHIGDEADLPLANLDDNIRLADALIDEREMMGEVDYFPTVWPPADVVIGNPPFLGSRYFAKERGYDYVRRVHKLYPDVPKMADYCVYWFRRAHDHLPACTPSDPLAGRAGLVGTQNIRNGESRVGGLDHVADTGTIVEAVDNQPWSGEANVHVSIANWIKTQDPKVVPEKKLFWTKATPTVGAKKAKVKGKRADKTFELAQREVTTINAALSDAVDVADAVKIKANKKPQVVFQGQNPANDQFMLSPREAREMLHDDAKQRDILFPYMIGRDLLTEGAPTRWVIDFGDRNMLEASQYDAAFERIKTLVMPMVLARAEKEKEATGKDNTRWTRMAERWWRLRDRQPGMLKAINGIGRYIVCSRVSKRPIFAFVSDQIRPDTRLMVFTKADDYSFGVLQSDAHWQWLKAKSSKLTERFIYTTSTVFDTFPWPQSPTAAQVDAVAAAGREVRRVRGEALAVVKGGLRAVYRTLELPGRHPLKDAHAALDAAVLAAYGFDAAGDLLGQLLSLNAAVAGRERAGEAVTPPGVPADYGDAAALVTGDCIRPAGPAELFGPAS